eukprot:2744347-Rhodomonas_salina.2
MLDLDRGVKCALTRRVVRWQPPVCQRGGGARGDLRGARAGHGGQSPGQKPASSITRLRCVG